MAAVRCSRTRAAYGHGTRAEETGGEGNLPGFPLFVSRTSLGRREGEGDQERHETQEMC
jgi:hypothetical protein